MRYVVAILLMVLSQMPLAMGYHQFTLVVKDAMRGVAHERAVVFISATIILIGLSAFTIGTLLLMKNFID